MSHTGRRPRPPTAPSVPPPPPASRWAAIGKAAILVWYGGGFALLLLGVLVQAGPFGWAAAWQVRHWGGDALVLTVLPGFLLLAAPVVVLQLLPRRPGWPFIAGAQDAIAPGRNFAVRPVTPDRMAQVLLTCARAGFVAAALFLAAGGIGFVAIGRIGNRGAGQPLPELTLAQATAPGATLPAYARLAGVTARPAFGWTHDHAVRQTRYRDRYIPLTGPSWRPGDLVMLLEQNGGAIDRSGVGDGLPEPAGAIEGSLAHNALPGWMVEEMRRSGMALAADPVVLHRQALGGVTPGADSIGAWFTAAGGVVLAALSGVVSLAWLYRRRRLLRSGTL